jgi:hypothetical protein
MIESFIGRKESKDFAFRVNTAEGYEALNLKSNDKNKHNIILSCKAL